MCIVTGPRIELAITLIDRMKGLFRNRSLLANSDSKGLFRDRISGLKFNTKETVIELNGVHIEAYPSHHLDAMRGLKDVSFIYLDEADFRRSTTRRQRCVRTIHSKEQSLYRHGVYS